MITITLVLVSSSCVVVVVDVVDVVDVVVVFMKTSYASDHGHCYYQ